MSHDVFKNHRGPYTLVASRPMKTKPNFWRTEVVARDVDSEDVEALAQMFMTDPRDTIADISVWSEREEQFVTLLRRTR